MEDKGRQDLGKRNTPTEDNRRQYLGKAGAPSTTAAHMGRQAETRPREAGHAIRQKETGREIYNGN